MNFKNTDLHFFWNRPLAYEITKTVKIYVFWKVKKSKNLAKNIGYLNVWRSKIDDFDHGTFECQHGILTVLQSLNPYGFLANFYRFFEMSRFWYYWLKPSNSQNRHFWPVFSGTVKIEPECVGYVSKPPQKLGIDLVKRATFTVLHFYMCATSAQAAGLGYGGCQKRLLKTPYGAGLNSKQEANHGFWTSVTGLTKNHRFFVVFWFRGAKVVTDPFK